MDSCCGNRTGDGWHGSIRAMAFRFIPAVSLLCSYCGSPPSGLHFKISVVNPPADIVTIGAAYIGKQIEEKSHGRMKAELFSSGVLSGGKGEAEIEMCQQGSIEMHVTSTAYLANLVPRTSIVSLPFLFRDLGQVVGIARSKSPVLDTINKELHSKNLHVIAWWPRGFRQLTNSKHRVKSLNDMRGLKLRVMNNPLYADNMIAMSANPVPMSWGQVYNSLQLKIIDGQENAEDVIYVSKLYEAQDYMTVWDYSVDLEVVIVNLDWWQGLEASDRELIQKIADASVTEEESLLLKNTIALRKQLGTEGMKIDYLSPEAKAEFRQSVRVVWDKYEKIFGKEFLDAFLDEMKKY